MSVCSLLIRKLFADKPGVVRRRKEVAERQLLIEAYEASAMVKNGARIEKISGATADDILGRASDLLFSPIPTGKKKQHSHGDNADI